MAAQEYDVIVIGAGPAGENVAARTVKGGLRTAISSQSSWAGNVLTGRAFRARHY